MPKFSGPKKYRKYEAWIRRLQKDYYCILSLAEGQLLTCICLYEDEPEPFYAFWTCSSSITRDKALWLILLRGFSLEERDR